MSLATSLPRDVWAAKDNTKHQQQAFISGVKRKSFRTGAADSKKRQLDECSQSHGAATDSDSGSDRERDDKEKEPLHDRSVGNKKDKSPRLDCVERFVKNSEIVAWGMIETIVGKTAKPFRYAPLFPYDTTPAQWFHSVLEGLSHQRMREIIESHHKSFLCGSIVYEDSTVIISKKNPDADAFYVHASSADDDDDDEIPRLIAAFFYVYDGGLLSGREIINDAALGVFLSAPIRASIAQATNRDAAFRRFKDALIRVTGNRTHREVLDQFKTVESLCEHLTVSAATSSYHVPVQYVHPQTNNSIAFAAAGTKILCRWTDVVTNPPDSKYVSDECILRNLTRNFGCAVDVAALECLRDEAELSSLTGVISSYCNWKAGTDRFTGRIGEITLDGLLANGNCLYGSDATQVVDLGKLTTYIEQIYLRLAFSDAVQTGVAPDGQSTVFYKNEEFVIGTCRKLSKEEETFLRVLNTDTHRRILRNVLLLLPPLVHDLCQSSVQSAYDYLNKASDDRLSPYLAQISFFNAEETTLARHLKCLFTTRTAYEGLETKESLLKTVRHAHETDHLDGCYMITTTEAETFLILSLDDEIGVYEISGNDVRLSTELTDHIRTSDIVAFCNSKLGRYRNLVHGLIKYVFEDPTRAPKALPDTTEMIKGNFTAFWETYYSIRVVGSTAFHFFPRRERLGERTVDAVIIDKLKEQIDEDQCETTTEFHIADVLRTKFTNHYVRSFQTPNGGSLFYDSDDGSEPVLYLYNGPESVRDLHEIAFSKWLASDLGRVGFLLLPTDIVPNTDDAIVVSDPIVPNCVLTLVVATPAAAVLHATNGLAPSDVWKRSFSCGPVDSAAAGEELPPLRTKLAAWLSGRAVTDADVRRIVQMHSFAVMSFASRNHRKVFHVGYSTGGKLTNTITDKALETVLVERLYILSSSSMTRKYGVAHVNSHEFDQIFAAKIVS
jgi:hypothetical protein